MSLDKVLPMSLLHQVDSIIIQEGDITFKGNTIILTGSTPSINVASGSTATFDTTKISGSNGLVKTGAGTLTLNDLGNDYSGTTTVSAGTLNIGSRNNILPTTTDLVIASGASVSIADGTNRHRVNSLSGAGSLDFGDNEFRIEGSGDKTFSGVISDNNGILRQQGTGTLTLSGNNTFTGTVDVHNGVIVAASNNALGGASSGNVVKNGAALHFSGGVSVNETNIAIEGSGLGGTGVLRNLSGNNTFSAGITLDGNSELASDSGTFTLDGDFTVGSYDLEISGSGDTVLSGALLGGVSAALTKNGTGTLLISGTSANTSGGSTTVSINDGTVQLDKTAGVNALGGNNVIIGDGTGSPGSAVLQLLSDNQIANGTEKLTINSDGKFDLNNFSESIDQLNSSGLISTGSSGYLGIGLNNGDSTLSGSVTGSGTIAQLGSGTLTLGSDIDFSNGAIVLSGGTLALNGHELLADSVHITADTVIDFGGNSTLNTANFLIDTGVTLTIQNWANNVDYFYATNWSGAIYDVMGSAPMNQVVFNGFSADDTKWASFDNQITPIPEPAVSSGVFVGLATLLCLGLGRRRPGKSRSDSVRNQA